MEKKKAESRGKVSASFATGAIALAFLAVGYQTALFIHRAAAMKILSDSTVPDTVYVAVSGTEDMRGGGLAGSSGTDGYAAGSLPGASVRSHGGKGQYSGTSGGGKTAAVRRRGNNPPAAAEVAAAFTPRTCESFSFNPNTVSVEELCRLGFTLKQAQSIENYRLKGGRFRRKEDFSKSFVVADSVYARLEPYIDIPLLDINAADSAEFDTLPGIGGYFASKMVEYRAELGGYSFKEQLMDIYNFGDERFAKLSDLVEVRTRPQPFRLWSLPADTLRLHPYISNWQTAKAIVLYRDNNPRNLWTASGLSDAGVIDSETAAKLSRCVIASPD